MHKSHILHMLHMLHISWCLLHVTSCMLHVPHDALLITINTLRKPEYACLDLKDTLFCSGVLECTVVFFGTNGSLRRDYREIMSRRQCTNALVKNGVSHGQTVLRYGSRLQLRCAHFEEARASLRHQSRC